MPRSARILHPDYPLHIVHRGHNREACFRSPNDYRRYLDGLAALANDNQCAVHGFVLMPNHVHLLISIPNPSACARLMKTLAQEHAQYMNWKHRSHGSFWEGRFHSCVVDSDRYFLACHRYIELNPVRASIVSRAQDYLWSSHVHNALAPCLDFITPHPTYCALAPEECDRRAAYRTLFDEPLPTEMVANIRRSTRSGRAFGSEQFLRRLGEELGTNLTLRKAGRRPRPIVTA